LFTICFRFEILLIGRILVDVWLDGWWLVLVPFKYC